MLKSEFGAIDHIKQRKVKENLNLVNDYFTGKTARQEYCEPAELLNVSN